MRTPLYRWLRGIVALILVLLAVQFELGMAINLSPSLPSLPAFAFSIPQIIQALQQIGAVALMHASLGAFILLLALINLALALPSHARGAKVFAVLAALTTFSAVYTGAGFTLSGFQNDGLSHGMATMFLLSLIFFFLELYMLKPVPPHES